MALAKITKCKLVFAGNQHQTPTEAAIVKAITQKTKIIAFATISNLLGYELDAQKITKAAKTKNTNILIICDATQMLPHKLIDVKKTNIDFLVASGHKMGSGTGIGLLYMKEKFFEQMLPLRLGGGMNNNVTCSTYTYASGPDKFEGGTPHTAGIIS
jgi:cysteine desulfurase/selenocysteine lyase